MSESKKNRAVLKPMLLEPLDNHPLVSVIIANYNYGRFLPDAVESVLKQTYPHFELIICDDGSTDESRSILPELERRDSRIIALYKENGGQASAWNVAFERSRGVVISFLDPDDMFLPDKLEKVVEAFRTNPAAGLVYHQAQPITVDGRPIGMPFPRVIESGWLADAALRRGGWGPGTVTSVLSFRRELARLVFPVPAEFWRGFGDAFIQGVAQLLVVVEALAGALTLYRIHGANLVGTLQPTMAGIAVHANARRDTFRHIRAFATDKCGDLVAAELRLEDIESYWEYLSALYVMSGKPQHGVHGYSAQDLLRYLPDTPRKQIWRGLFLLPARLSKSAFRLWWGESWWKRYTRPVTSLLRLG